MLTGVMHGGRNKAPDVRFPKIGDSQCNPGFGDELECQRM